MPSLPLPKYVVFIDFDGVTHPLPGRTPRSLSDVMMRIDYFCPPNVSQVNRLMAALSAVGVITSAWRLDFPWQDFQHYFDMRLAGQTPWLEKALWSTEIESFLSEQEWGAVPWLAIDDNPRLFSPGSPVLVTDASVGLTSAEVDLYLAKISLQGTAQKTSIVYPCCDE